MSRALNHTHLLLESAPYPLHPLLPHFQYLLQAIETSRHRVELSDADLTKLLTDVQKSRDDRTLLHDSLERLLHDLRAQSHSQAFLTRVNKRDAPDYYDVIKNPMDLGLMLKNVKSGKYRSKEAFRKDLDLIWDNCLLYNNEPVSDSEGRGSLAEGRLGSASSHLSP